jgi:hypothetical protein
MQAARKWVRGLLNKKLVQKVLRLPEEAPLFFLGTDTLKGPEHDLVVKSDLSGSLCDGRLNRFVGEQEV